MAEMSSIFNNHLHVQLLKFRANSNYSRVRVTAHTDDFEPEAGMMFLCNCCMESFYSPSDVSCRFLLVLYYHLYE
uniref:Uncharacterized protein n=1 Tax=Anopheles quadriannulatus TaxID=34691 RepID=A0A182XRT5_ANOQN